MSHVNAVFGDICIDYFLVFPFAKYIHNTTFQNVGPSNLINVTRRARTMFIKSPLVLFLCFVSGERWNLA